jgi:hypothetical protein
MSGSLCLKYSLGLKKALYCTLFKNSANPATLGYFKSSSWRLWQLLIWQPWRSGEKIMKIPTALTAFQAVTHFEVMKSGLWLDSCGFLGASTDGNKVPI